MNIHAQSQSSLFNRKPHLFRLSDEILACFDMEDIRATYNDMLALNLDKDPYPFYAIEVKVKFMYLFGKKVGLLIGEDDRKDTSIMQATCVFIYELDDDGEHYHFDALMQAKGKYVDLLAAASSNKNKEQERYINGIVEYLRYFLMVILATKNAEKTTKKNLARAVSPQQRKDAAKYPYTTTIKIGKITEEYGASTGLGGTKRPHLRRGHIRTQHFGKGNAEIKQVFIQPVFVNADENWVNEQKTYRVIK
jgi:hypothetical protein